MRITRWNPILLVLLSIAIPAGIPMGIAAAHSQPQDDALADAARRAQAEKKTQPTQQKVWTDEDIPKTPGAISIVGTVLPSPAAGNANNPAGAAPAGAAKAGTPASTVRNKATVQSELEAAKLDLNTATTDLDILTRKNTLDSQTYYGKPDYASDTEGAAQLKDEQDEIDAKKQQVDDAQKKVSDLQSELDALSTEQGAASGNSTSDTSSTNPTSNAPGTPTDTSSSGASSPANGGWTTPSN